MSALLIWLSDWQQGANNLATVRKTEKFLNTHPISILARFEMIRMKPFSVNVWKPQIIPILSQLGGQIFGDRAGSQISCEHLPKHTLKILNELNENLFS